MNMKNKIIKIGNGNNDENILKTCPNCSTVFFGLDYCPICKLDFVTNQYIEEDSKFDSKCIDDVSITKIDSEEDNDDGYIDWNYYDEDDEN